MTVALLWNQAIPTFVKCLKSLPNLHTLEIGRADCRMSTTVLESALKRVELPQIKTLIIAPNTYPLIQHCGNVEGVDCVTWDGTLITDYFLQALASIQDSKIKRLAIPLVLPENPPGRRFSTLY